MCIRDRYGRCQARACAIPVTELWDKVHALQLSNNACFNGGKFSWTLDSIRSYEERLGDLARNLLALWEENQLFPAARFNLLLVPSGKLFELPWAALPLGSG